MRKIKTVCIVSLSAGILGERFVKHELDLGLKRLEACGLKVKFSSHALMGTDYLSRHPEARAADFCEAFRDTTTNHLMLHKLGLPSFYGQAFLTELCELDKEMLPYSRQYFEEFIETGRIAEIRPSPVWYEGRELFDETQLGVAPVAHPNTGFALVQGSPVFRGKILGGCIDTIFDYFDGGRYADSPAVCARYGLFPHAEDWRGRILLLESSEEKPSPEKYRRGLLYLKEAGVLEAVSGLLIGKPMDEAYDAAYRAILKEVVDDPAKPILCNLSIGHAMPRCILPFGAEAEVNADEQVIRFFY